MASSIFGRRTDDLAADIDVDAPRGREDWRSVAADARSSRRLSPQLGARDFPRLRSTARLPFLIKDDTPRDERVPRERSHRNGATGIRTLALAVDDPGITSRSYARVLGRPGRARRARRPRSRGCQLHDRSE